MNIEFLKALHSMCSELSNKDTTDPREKLHSHFLYTAEAERELNSLLSLMEQLTTGMGKSESEQDEAEMQVREAIIASEEQGFINGFRYGMMLSNELRADYSHDLWHPLASWDIGKAIRAAV